MRVAFDIGGVLSKHPATFRKMVTMFQTGGIEVFIITDMHDVNEIFQMLLLNGFDTIPKENVRSADYTTFGEGCKSELLRELQIDLFFDDFLPYVVIPDHTIRCLVLPDPFKPYWHDDWKIIGDNFEFGRRRYMRK